MTHLHGTPSAQSRKRLAIVLAITCTVLVAEIVGGWLSGSLALLADAGHLFTDVAALGLALFAIWFAQRPSPPHRTYGYFRAEILAAVANAVLLALVTFFVIREALERLQDPPEILALPVLLIGSIGLMANVIGIKLLHHDAQHSLNVRGAYLEVLADTLGSIGVILSAGLHLAFGWRLADPLVSLGIALFIIPRIWILLREATDILMEAAPRDLEIERVRQAMLQQQGVTDVHDLHVWTITSGRVCLSAHVVTRAETDRDDVISRINRVLRLSFGLDHTTLQVEGETGLVANERGSNSGCDPCPHDVL